MRTTTQPRNGRLNALTFMVDAHAVVRDSAALWSTPYLRMSGAPRRGPDPDFGASPFDVGVSCCSHWPSCEAVAVRLESQPAGAPAARAPGAPPPPPPPPPPAAAGAAPAASAASPSVAAFDDLINGSLKKWCDLAAPLGPEIVEATALFQAAFQAGGVLRTSTRPTLNHLLLLLLLLLLLYPRRVRVGIHPEGKSGSNLSRVLGLNDPPTRRSATSSPPSPRARSPTWQGGAG